ncbi:MAG TPA: hypothetical protein VKS78_17445 [Roseiarcus sp.]|nr:hypothetical protein [Roseiarcus sp.]
MFTTLLRALASLLLASFILSEGAPADARCAFDTPGGDLLAWGDGSPPDSHFIDWGDG